MMVLSATQVRSTNSEIMMGEGSKGKGKLTSGSGQDHVGVFRAGGDGSDPAGMTGQGALEHERLRHCAGYVSRVYEEMYECQVDF